MHPVKLAGYQFGKHKQRDRAPATSAVAALEVQPPVVAAHERPGRILEVGFAAEREPRLPANRVRAGMTGGRERVHVLGPAHRHSLR